MAEKDAPTRLRRAVKDNNLFVVKRLIKRTDMHNPDPTNKRYSSLAWAAVLGNEETFEFLLSEGHDDREYSKDSDNNTILILLADARPPPNPYGSGPSEHEFNSATLRMARLYYDHYSDILDWANVEGKTALHVAATRGNEELVRMLCDFGADFDLPDNEGNTPLHYASAWGHITIVQLLIERGCQYSVRNNEGFTPSDYAYSVSTKDVLQDTARAQFEQKKRARQNVFAQAAQRGFEWQGRLPPPPPRMYAGSSGSVRMRSGSGTSRTTTTSDSDYSDNYSTPQQSRSHHPTFASSLSPSRHPGALPSAYSPGQPSAGSSSSTTLFTVPSPSPVTAHSYSAIPPPMTTQLNAAAASALSPIANRMRERDADAMEKYKLRQRSGSAATTSTDAHSANGATAATTSSSSREEDISPLHSLVTIGSVAPRRLLRPSASAAQLRSPTSPQNTHALLQDSRNRSGTTPATLNQTPLLTSSPPDSILLSTPTQSSSRPLLHRNGGSAKLVGSGTDLGQFPPPAPPPREPPEKPTTSSSSSTFPSLPMFQAALPTLPTRRLPFNLLSSHHRHGGDQAHKRNASVNSLGAKVS